MPHAQFLSESGCKGTTIFRITKTFPDFFAIKQKVFAFVDNAKTLHLIIYIYESLSLAEDTQQIDEEIYKIKIERERSEEC